jgi:hypothetical protein
MELPWIFGGVAICFVIYSMTQQWRHPEGRRTASKDADGAAFYVGDSTGSGHSSDGGGCVSSDGGGLGDCGSGGGGG